MSFGLKLTAPLRLTPSALPLSASGAFDIFSTGSTEHRLPTPGHTQHYIEGHTGLQFTATHSSHAFADSHTVDSPSSAGVINDFPWLFSNRPSIADPLFLIEAPTSPPHPISVLSLSHQQDGFIIRGKRKRSQAGGGRSFSRYNGFQHISGDMRSECAVMVRVSATC